VPSSRRGLRLVRLAAPAGLWLAAACVPHAGPLTGVPTTRRLPDSALPAGYQRVVFHWEVRQHVYSARGDGSARIAPPDSVRLDFFLENGASGGFVILIADSLRLAPQDDARRYVPPVPMLWAALGRLAVAAPDTVVRLDGDTLRADIGRDPVWRAAFGPDGLVRLERIEGGRIRAAVERRDPNHVEFSERGSGRSLRLEVLHRYAESGFDGSIWRP
jgi:hypothetical protein